MLKVHIHVIRYVGIYLLGEKWGDLSWCIHELVLSFIYILILLHIWRNKNWDAEDKVFHRHYNFFLSMSENLSKSEQDIFTLLRWVQYCISWLKIFSSVELKILACFIKPFNKSNILRVIYIYIYIYIRF
jgi:hypothetical protein